MNPQQIETAIKKAIEGNDVDAIKKLITYSNASVMLPEVKSLDLLERRIAFIRSISQYSELSDEEIKELLSTIVNI